MKTLLLSFFTLLFLIPLTAQTDFEKKGDAFMKWHTYERALREYLKAYSKEKENSPLLEKIIECYLKDETLRDAAIPYIEAYATLNPSKPVIHYQMAQALFHGHRFDEATVEIDKYLASASGNSQQEQGQQLKQQIKTASHMVANAANVKIINLGADINTSRADINPIITADHQTLFFSCDERFNSYANIYYYNIKVSENRGVGWDKAKTPGGNINTIYDETVSGFGNKSRELYFFHNRNKEAVLASAPYLGTGKIGMAFDMGLPFDMKGPEYSATQSVTGDTIIFSGLGTNNKTNLYFTIRMPDGKWGEARPLPWVEDSAYDDNYPNYSPDGSRLYFSSNRPGSMGGYDLYYSDYNTESKSWEKAVQLPYPINDTYDNNTICFSADQRYAYISTVRPEGYGNKDIYQVVFPEKLAPTAIYRCHLEIQNRPSNRKLEGIPSFLIFDDKNQLTAELKNSNPKSPFLMVLEPGKYIIRIASDETEPFELNFEVPENAFTNEANIVTFLLTPKKNQ